MFFRLRMGRPAQHLIDSKGHRKREQTCHGEGAQKFPHKSLWMSCNARGKRRADQVWREKGLLYDKSSPWQVSELMGQGARKVHYRFRADFYILGPAVTAFREREGADALAGNGKNCVAHC